MKSFQSTSISHWAKNSLQDKFGGQEYVFVIILRLSVSYRRAFHAGQVKETKIDTLIVQVVSTLG